MSERRACRVLRQPRSTQRYCFKAADEEEPLTIRIVELAAKYGRYGYRRITALLRDEGWRVNHKRVERIWRREWLSRVDVKSLFIEPGSPWEHGYVESFNGKFRDELLNGEIFFTLTEAKVLVERWRHEYNTKRPHSSLGYRPPAPETVAAAPPLGGASSLSSLEIAAVGLT